eukprot:m.156636 g.156636  ORF g.156636 m.156636 type:complete len:494 (+) comp17943_c0_seq2:76-1557(+)
MVSISLLCSVVAALSAEPTDNPFLTLYPAGATGAGRAGFSTSNFPWKNVISVDAKVALHDPATAYKTAAQHVLQNNSAGGVVYFPTGTYTFKSSFKLVDRVVLRGEPTTANATGAKRSEPGNLDPKTIFEFPDRSYSQITCANCTMSGIVNVASDGGGVQFTQGATSTALDASMPFLLVLSNTFRNIAYKYPVPPPGTSENMWPYRFATAISITGDSNVFVANNVVAKATRTASAKLKLIAHPVDNDDTVPAGRVQAASPPPASPCTMSTDFPYDNRYGIRHNSNGGVTANVSIVGNWVYQNGRVGVMWYSNDGLGAARGNSLTKSPSRQGLGVAVMYNHVEVAAGTVCWTVEGTKLARGSDTNENRGYNQAGSGSFIAYNTGNVNRQRTPSGCNQAGSYETTDGEGILQQIQDGAAAERDMWIDNDLSAGSAGPLMLYALHSIADLTIEGNTAGAGGTLQIGIVAGGSTPKNGTAVANLVCKDNKPAAHCHA